jgi:hypothetical protein
MGFQEGFKDPARKVGVVAIYVVVGGVLGVYVKPFECV